MVQQIIDMILFAKRKCMSLWAIWGKILIQTGCYWFLSSRWFGQNGTNLCSLEDKHTNGEFGNYNMTEIYLWKLVMPFLLPPLYDRFMQTNEKKIYTICDLSVQLLMLSVTVKAHNQCPDTHGLNCTQMYQWNIWQNSGICYTHKTCLTLL